MREGPTPGARCHWPLGCIERPSWRPHPRPASRLASQRPLSSLTNTPKWQISVLLSYARRNYDLQCFPSTKHVFALALSVGTLQPLLLDGLMMLVDGGQTRWLPIGSSRVVWRGEACFLLSSRRPEVGQQFPMPRNGEVSFMCTCALPLPGEMAAIPRTYEPEVWPLQMSHSSSSPQLYQLCRAYHP